MLLGIVMSILALFVGGDPRILLIRESLFTGAFGIVCLASLTFPRPIMFYFGRYFMAGKNQQRRATFDARWQYPAVRHAHRLVTGVWGLVYAGEFVFRVVLVYSLSAPVVLLVSPAMIGLATIFTVIWTFRYANKGSRSATVVSDAGEPLLGLATLAASWVPARRASSVDPVVALRAG